jgi:ATP-dependent RNA circularization protein (DNA/RNA ligase family)
MLQSNSVETEAAKVSKEALNMSRPGLISSFASNNIDNLLQSQMNFNNNFIGSMMGGSLFGMTDASLKKQQQKHQLEIEKLQY